MPCFTANYDDWCFCSGQDEQRNGDIHSWLNVGVAVIFFLQFHDDCGVKERTMCLQSFTDIIKRRERELYSYF